MTQVIITLLMLDALLVFCGLIRKRNMWGWICIYWLLLTIKNACDWAGVR